MRAGHDFHLFQLTDDHEALRAAIRAVAEDKIAPEAARVDEQSSFPLAAYDALRATDFHAPHIPEQFDGAGADAVATCIVIEEVVRVCAASSLIPTVNKLGTVPLLIGGSKDICAKYLPRVARGEAMFSYALSEREAGSDIASMTCRARPSGDDWILNGHKAWITNAGVSDYYTVLAVTDPDGRRGGNISAFVIERSDVGFGFGEPEKKPNSGVPNCVAPYGFGDRSARLPARGSVYRRHRQIRWDPWLRGPAIQGNCAGGGQAHALNLARQPRRLAPGVGYAGRQIRAPSGAGTARDAISRDPSPARSSRSITPTIAPKLIPNSDAQAMLTKFSLATAPEIT